MVLARKPQVSTTNRWNGSITLFTDASRPPQFAPPPSCPRNPALTRQTISGELTPAPIPANYVYEVVLRNIESEDDSVDTGHHCGDQHCGLWPGASLEMRHLSWYASALVGPCLCPWFVPGLSLIVPGKWSKGVAHLTQIAKFG